MIRHLPLNAPFTAAPDGAWVVLPGGDDPAKYAQTGYSKDGLRVRAAGADPVTGEPAFTYTTGQEGDGGAGAADHIKWFALANHTASTGILGFDTEPGQVFSYSATMAARTYGTERHPFGPDVAGDDLRLAAGALNTADPETGMVFDFFLTNRRLYAFYERLPGPATTYRSFSYALPVAARHPDQLHHLGIVYDRSAGVVTWFADGRQVLRVDRLGLPPSDTRHLILEIEGEPQRAEPRQLACGIGMFALLDAAPVKRDGPGLVRISDTTAYRRPATFLDEQSRPGNRLWGQGAELLVTSLTVSSARRQGDAHAIR